MLACSLAWLGTQLTALELSDIPFPLTRSEADETLSKDYTYALLTDGTIRRTWTLPDKKVFIDFDPNSDEALLIAVIYNKPVPKKQGIADAHTLGSDKMLPNASWDAPKDKASKDLISDTFGLTNAKRKKLQDKAMLFYESKSADKDSRITRVSLFSQLPHADRWTLAPVEPGEKKTAMGSNLGNSYIEDIYKDEARRQALPLRSATAAASAAAPAPETPSATVQSTRTAMGARSGRRTSSNLDASATGGEITVPGLAAKQQKKIRDRQEASTKMLSTLPAPPDWLKQVGIAHPEWWHYIALGAGALLLLFIIFRAMSKASQRAERQKKFAQVVSGKRGLR